MKKSLLGLLLAVALVIPSFAVEKGSMEVNLKGGLYVSPTLSVSGNEIAKAAMSELDMKSISNSIGITGDTGLTVEADFFYYVSKNLAVGVGANRVFPNSYLNSLIAQIDSYNAFAAVKQRFDINTKLLDGIYLLGRLGYGFNNIDSDISTIIGSMSGSTNVDISMNDGIYWAIGFGVEQGNWILEAVYSVNYSKIDAVISDTGSGDRTPISIDSNISSININIGYKFAI